MIARRLGAKSARTLQTAAAVGMRTDFDVSVVLTFSDDEEIIGNACRRVAAHLRGRGLSFEIIAVDEDSRDNSHAVLALVRTDVPELRVVAAAVRDRGFATGARQARGRALWMLDAATASAPLAPFGRAYRFVARGEADAVVIRHRFTVCYRTRCVETLDSVRGRGEQFQARFTRRAKADGLECAVHELGAAAASEPRPWSKLLGALTAARATFVGTAR